MPEHIQFCSSGDCCLGPRRTLLPTFKSHQQETGRPSGYGGCSVEPARPACCFCRHLPSPSCARRPSSAPPPPRPLVSYCLAPVLLCPQEPASLTHSGVRESRPQDRAVWSFCNPCPYAGKPSSAACHLARLPSLSPRTRPSCLDRVASWHSPRVTLPLPGACARCHLQRLCVR